MSLVLKAALFTFVAIGGMATGLGLTTYTVAKANDLVVASITGSDSAAGQPVSCFLE